MKKITVIGSGAWGTALALTLCQPGVATTLYCRNEEIAASINQTHRNEYYLPEIALPTHLRASCLLPQALQADVLLITTPTQFLREMCIKLKEASIAKEIVLVLCCKGIETHTLKLTNEIVADILPDNPVAILSGPNFADEVALGLPAATTISCGDNLLGNSLVQLFSHTTLRPYYSTDIIGTQIGGAVKNVLAIACGILEGKMLGENAKAALMTRGLAEMVRLGIAKGGKMETLMGLSGMGDLLLTCSSAKSRNMSLGISLGKGKSLQQILESRKNITEGVASAESVVQLAAQLEIEMPICEAVYKVLYHNLAIDTAIQGLLQRPLTNEI